MGHPSSSTTPRGSKSPIGRKLAKYSSLGSPSFSLSSSWRLTVWPSQRLFFPQLLLSKMVKGLIPYPANPSSCVIEELGRFLKATPESLSPEQVQEGARAREMCLFVFASLHGCRWDTFFPVFDFILVQWLHSNHPAPDISLVGGFKHHLFRP